MYHNIFDRNRTRDFSVTDTACTTDETKMENKAVLSIHATQPPNKIFFSKSKIRFELMKYNAIDMPCN